MILLPRTKGRDGCGNVKKLGYLTPPPAPAPVIVMKDTGGLVDKYWEQTAAYRSEGREVRLHECRSACTMALSLPNVCVYPSSVLKFHLAYDWNTKEVSSWESSKLYASYPPAVQQRLGQLTRAYKNLSGSELIRLGIRNCDDKRILVARNEKPAASPGGLSRVMQDLASVFTPEREQGRSPQMQSAPQPGQPAAVRARTVPVQTAAIAPPEPPTATQPPSLDHVPTPPVRPKDFGLTKPGLTVETGWGKPIPGAQLALQPYFVPYRMIIR